MIINDFLQLQRENQKGPTFAIYFMQRPEVKLDFKAHPKDCQALIDLATAKAIPMVMIDGHVCLATLCVFAINEETANLDRDEREAMTSSLKEQGLAHIAAARATMEKYPSAATDLLKTRVDAAEQRLTNDPFYQAVTTDELRAVVAAMAREFSPTGHWYTCANGHPFTVGDCGGPMVEAQCPECGAPIGGQHHVAAEGVHRTQEIEDLMTGVEQL
jgi:hypothetical protein